MHLLSRVAETGRKLRSGALVTGGVAGAAALTSMDDHQRVIAADSFAVGVLKGVGYVLGTPRELYEAGRAFIKGERRNPEELDFTPESINRALIDKGYRRLVDAPKIRAGTDDDLVREGAEIAGTFATFLVPVGAVARGASTVTRGAVAATEALTGSSRAAGVALKTAEGIGRIASKPSVQFGSAAAVVGAQFLPAHAAQTPPSRSTSLHNSERNIIQSAFDPVKNLADGANPSSFDFDKVETLQKSLVARGYLKGKNEIDGFMGPHTAKALDRFITDTIDPAKLTAAQKATMRESLRHISEDLKENPASPWDHDPRVLAAQVYGRSLGLYKGQIDGLYGDKTQAALDNLNPSPDQRSRTPTVSMIPPAPTT